MTLHQFNALTPADAVTVLLQACRSQEWATQLVARRPFAGRTELLAAADQLWLGLSEADWFDAFGAHPRIGERSDSALSQREQAVALAAGDQVKQALARGNKEYEKRFGFIFLVFAAGKTAEEILELLGRRIRNDRATEIRNAAVEQMKITRRRLETMIS